MKRLIIAALMACAFHATSAFAATYSLMDHPDGVLTSLPTVSYGLRLDQLGGTDAAKTFSVLSLTATFDGAVTASLSGSIQNNGDSLVYGVSHTFTGVAAAVGGGFTATGGTLVLTGAGSAAGTYISKQDTSGIAFELLHDGHRLSGDNSTPVARGWLVDPGSTGCCNDWLLKGTEVPVPAAAWLFGSGIAGLAAIRRRKPALAA